MGDVMTRRYTTGPLTLRKASLWRLAVVAAVGLLALSALPTSRAQAASGSLTTFQIVTPSAPPVVPANGTAVFTAEAGTTGNPGLLSGVVITWSVTDSNGTPAPGCGTVSPSSSTTGVDGRASTTLTAGPSDPGVSGGCQVWGDAGSKTAKQKFIIDSTPPSLTVPADMEVETEDEGGAVVTFSVTATDDHGTPTVVCTPPSGSTFPVGTTTVSCTATDSVGNSTTETFTITVVLLEPAIVVAPADTTAPTIVADVTGTLGNGGWYTSDVTVTWTVTDGESAIGSQTGCDAVTISTDTAGTTLTCTATSAGGTASATVTIKRDATKPVTSASASPAPNGSGWNNTDVTVTFTGTDGGSGIATCDPAVTLSTEGAGQSASGSCTDVAGNVSDPATASNINIDKTAPVVTVSGVSNLGSYSLGSVPAAGCSTTDSLSGVATSATVTVTGGNANGVGTFTVTCSAATDNAGNAGAGASASYTVTYVFCGFKQPLLVPVQSYKTGSTIPVKFCVRDGNGQSVATAVATVSANGVPQGVARYDATDQQYIFNLRTKGMAVGPLTISVAFDDGTTQSIGVTLK
ncbi:MAG: HYR domain-containing protein [Dehalococcoidia bacterium]|nr:MAG: HYR domain-containing protein [Dehalococcoidia bacterium]